ncbi:peptide/nickel transport system ATP-binding protein [Nonomuraea fuscirosea]|uniref:Peptide/nickel transport system ATP-binding protein n=1 Tax=Nonomuraea fuscirosea TaxID=1291556 RepID=A0A2T0MDX4_9ACTN|nr:ABC transporter ATP-binding protein [Nonomuraea fuscirosea]PRX55702.1 peptide/nickel transport system ATP-binding protein [Nonomuraea fuscirosea]
MNILEGRDLTKHFTAARGPRGRFGKRPPVRAVEDVSIALRAGAVTALVGESGCGKSTVARLLAQVYPPTSGEVLLRGEPVRAHRGAAFREYRRQVQLIFQDPFASLNPFHRVRYHLARPLRLHGHARTDAEEREQVAELLERVSLTPVEQFMDKMPHELSGGQRQRVAIARALAVRPVALIADEPVSMLDVSIRLGVLRLLEGLARENDLALLYITHDIASARYFAEDITVMYAGRLIESGPSEELTQSPRHPYTRLLLESAPDPDRVAAPEGRRHGEPPSLIDPPGGCRFHPRCPVALPVCSTEVPGRTELGEGHWTHCWQAEATLAR